MNSTTLPLFQIEQTNETLILVATKNIGAFQGDQIRDEAGRLLKHWDNANAKNIIVDLNRTDYCGSSFLELLVQLWKNVRRRNGQMILCCASKQEKEVLFVTGFENVWKCCESQEDALATIRQSALDSDTAVS